MGKEGQIGCLDSLTESIPLPFLNLLSVQRSKMFRGTM